MRTTIKDRNNHQKIQETDVFGRLIKVEEYTGNSTNTYALYATTKYEYDERDLLKKVTDEAGNVTEITYDNYGRKIEMTDPDLGSWSYEYDVVGNLHIQTDARGCATTITYDDLNRPTFKSYIGPGACDSTPDVTYTYDSTVDGNEGLGHRTGISDSNSSTTWFYNALGQATNETHTIEHTDYSISTSPDAFGRPLSQTIPSNGGTETLTYGYNAMGALSSLFSATTTYVSSTTYDAAGRIDARAFGNGIQTDYSYYPWSTTAQGGRLQQSVTQKTNDQSYVHYGLSTDTPVPSDYDGDGDTDIAVFRSSTFTWYVKDQFITSYGSPGDKPIPGDYNGDGRSEIAVYRPSNSTFYVQNQPAVPYGISSDTPIPGDYDRDGDTDVAVYRSSNSTFYVKDQFSVAYGIAGDIPIPGDYDGDGDTDVAVYRPSNYTFYIQNKPAVQFGIPGDIPVPNDYDGDGDTDIAVFRPSNGVWYIKDQFSVQHGSSSDKLVPGDYDRDGKTDVAVFHPTDVAWDILQTTALRNLTTYSYDAVGNISSIQDGIEIHTFGYDELDRLKSATAINGPAPYAQTYAYNPIGNMTTKNNTIGYTYDPAHKHAVTTLTTGESYTYDANGNMICRVENGTTYKQDYNAENLLSAVYKMNGNCTSGTVLETTSFVYDGDGNLVKEIKPDGSKTLYVGGIYEVDKNSGDAVTRTVTYYPAGAMRINSTLYYVLKDHLGSARMVTDASGNLLGEQGYYPFGETRFMTGTMYTDKLFTGQREMAELGIYHYGARFYSPYINRFLSADTIVAGYANPQNLNRYSYVLNNPLRYTDPTGHRCVEAGIEGGCPAVEDKMTKKWKADLEAARNRNKKKNDSPTPTAIIATLLDDAAALTNLGYAAVGDGIGLLCPECYVGVVGFYQVYSVIPNSISTLATAVWITDGAIKGENNFSFSHSSGETSISLSIAQDTAVSVVTNILGWTVLREPNVASGVDIAVAAYDTAGLGIPGTNVRLPTFVNPTVTYNTQSGFSFSWHQR